MKKLLCTFLAALLLALPAHAQFMPMFSPTNAYHANLVKLDGSTAYLDRSTALSGAVDTKTFIFAVYLIPSNVSSTPVIVDLGDGTGHNWHPIRVDIGGTTSGKLSIKGVNASGSEILNAVGSTTLVNGTGYAILISIDMSSSSNRSVVINGSTETMTWNTYTNDVLAFSTKGAFPRLGARSDTPDLLYSGDWADMYLVINNTYSSASTLYSSFYNGSNKPISKGATGQLPTGSTPYLLLTGKAASAGTNSTGAGNYTIEGGFTDDGTL